MTILDKIVNNKKQEVRQDKEASSIKELEQSVFFNRETISLKKNLSDNKSSGIIAEFKRRSPSKGVLNDTVNPVDVIREYESAGVAGSSVLTDKEFFGGGPMDLINVRNEVQIPLLRKDFMIDEYQFIEARSIGADVILLIASILTKNEVEQFTDLAHSMGLEVLLELHGENELDHVYHKVDMIGINNRNLKTFEVDTERSIRMAENLGKDFVLVAESGISSPEDVVEFRKYGFSGFLIGETFMRTSHPGVACREFILHLRLLNSK